MLVEVFLASVLDRCGNQGSRVRCIISDFLIILNEPFLKLALISLVLDAFFAFSATCYVLVYIYYYSHNLPTFVKVVWCNNILLYVRVVYDLLFALLQNCKFTKFKPL